MSWSTVVLAVIAITFAAVVLYQNFGAASDKTERIERDKLLEDIAVMEDVSKAFIAVAAALKPSVVSITNVGVTTTNPFTDDPLLRRFFGRIPDFRPREGAGSGLIISDDGYILTNNHVVTGSRRLTVKLHDGREYKAGIIGADSQTDIALIKIEATGLVPAPLGDSDDLKVGQWVIAIGKPFGLEQTVTAGIVSALHRSKVGVAAYESFIQTDAAVNPGSSGGPLINLKGKVVGINTAIATKTGGYQGIGFSIPINLAKRVKDALMSDGRVRRSYIGVYITDVTPEAARLADYSGHEGALVSEVIPNGPAEKAGFKEGDIVIEYAGKKVKTSDHFRSLVSTTGVGTDVSIKVVREGTEMELKVKLAALEDAESPPRKYVRRPPEQTGGIGLGIEELTSEEREAANIGEGEGVYIADVVEGSFAASAGLKERDVILEVNGRKTGSIDDFASALDSADPEKGINFKVRRGGADIAIYFQQSR
jgi:serine protease Do